MLEVRREVSEMPVVDGEWHRVLYVDGIWLAHGLDALICRSDECVVRVRSLLVNGAIGDLRGVAGADGLDPRAALWVERYAWWCGF